MKTPLMKIKSFITFLLVSVVFSSVSFVGANGYTVTYDEWQAMYGVPGPAYDTPGDIVKLLLSIAKPIGIVVIILFVLIKLLLKLFKKPKD